MLQAFAGLTPYILPIIWTTCVTQRFDFEVALMPFRFHDIAIVWIVASRFSEPAPEPALLPADVLLDVLLVVLAGVRIWKIGDEGWCLKHLMQGGGSLLMSTRSTDYTL